VTDFSQLAWYKQASLNLRKYVAELEACRAGLERRQIDMRATGELLVEAKRRLAELDKLLVRKKFGDIDPARQALF
jgi:hypothetical protein